MASGDYTGILHHDTRSMSSQHQVTQLLLQWANGDKDALDQLMPLVYGELQRLASDYLRRERREHTLQPTALVHEAYLRLVKQDLPDWQNRSHFYGVAAHMMRQILVDHARAHLASKRGSGVPAASIEEALTISDEHSAGVLALDDALTKLAAIDPRKSTLVELRYFGGLSVEEMSTALNISVATVGRVLRLAKAWLFHEMKTP